MSEIIYYSHKEAKVAGAKTYYGKPCKICQSNIRYTSNCGCDNCRKKYHKIYNQSKAFKEYQKYLRDSGYSKNYHLKRNHGISLKDFKKILKSQNGVCAICHTKSHKNLYVDHNHKTGKIRGLLCQKCNFGLGQFNDSIILLNNAIKYLN